MFRLTGIGLLFISQAAAFPVYAAMAPDTFMDLEEGGQYGPVLFPGMRAQPGNLCQGARMIGQGATAPQVKQQQQIRAVLFGAQVHRIGEIIADIHRHPDIGLTYGQRTVRFVLCP